MRSAHGGGELSAAVLQVTDAAAKLLGGGDSGGPEALRHTLIQRFGARTVSKARAQLEELVPGYANLELSS
eukprot:COSAG02_NODE_28501_length_588_cov_0.957055_1_plen_70_part_10